MYIKEIRANGFKSFADKIDISLNKTFTGIVGPNGSGKSNIVDAVKWVLGEQSVKTLRGDKGMTDVIFAGSKSRSPQNSASITIVFDNSDKHLPIDFDIVSIKRILYRSGENEYYINNTKSRLKDINNLFVDSFSSKESFNIISQGKVQEILSNKPEDRRVILEEAAGVLKYKKRKEESLRKLGRTHENIDKIDLIIDELNTNISPLRSQAEKAIKYKEAKEKLEEIEVSVIVNDITLNNQIYSNKKIEKENLEKESQLQIGNSSILENELEELKLKQIKVDNDINNLQIEFNTKNNELSKINEKKELVKERSKYDTNDIVVKKNLIDIKENIFKLDSYIKNVNNEKRLQEEELENILKTLDNRNEEYKKISSKKNLKEITYNNLNKQILINDNKKESLKISLESDNKIPYSVKMVLNNQKLEGIINILGKVVNTDADHLKALDTAMGASSNFVIVKDDLSLKSAISYLKSSNLGRVTFFPVNVIKPRGIENDILRKIENDEGYVDVLSNLLSYDKFFYNVVLNQFGNIIVARNIDDATRISRLINYRYRIVTLDGEIIHVGGSVTGGSSKNNSQISEKFELSRLQFIGEGYEKEFKISENDLRKINKDLEDIKNEIYNKTLEKVRISELIKGNEKKIEDLVIEKNIKEEELSTLSGNTKEEIDKTLNNIMQDYYDLLNDKEKIESELNNFKILRKRLIDDINTNEEKIKKYNSKNNLSNKSIHDLEIELVKIGMNLDNLLSTLSTEYNITYEKAKDNIKINIEIEDARKEVLEIKSKIKLLGDVNLGSISEYERVSTRFDFLNYEKNDLLQSENNLLGMVNEMDETMESKFIETFHKVNKEFTKVFNKLFCGGEAYLELTDPDNILETGVDIKATPPGKKLSSVTLLSGGEKTLTAISLLFAIMNVNNVPFAILDEVEAALDEANVDRFGEYLENYKNKTQLLIITHKKKTMEYVDLLYGITMQESGVSKLVSVKLEEVK